MKKSLIRIVLCFVLSSSVLLGQLMRGDGWNRMGEMGDDGFDIIAKQSYIFALSDSSFAYMIMLGDVFIELDLDYSVRKKLFEKMESSPYFAKFYGATFKQIVAGVDEVYKDYANIHIPVLAIASLVNRRIMGEISDENFQVELVKLRSVKWPESK